MKRLKQVASRLREQPHDTAFLAGCGLIVGGFAILSPVSGMFAGGIALIVLSVLHDRGSGEE